MQRSCRFGILAVMAVALSGCGAAPPKTDKFPCPPGAIATTRFCLTPAEIALGQSNVHDPTIPDSAMLGLNVSLTIGPHDKATVSESQAEASAVNAFRKTQPSGFQPNVNSAVLVLLHGGDGNPAQGTLVWFVDVTPTGGIQVACGGLGGCKQTPRQDQFSYVAVNAVTGIAIDSGSV